MRSSRHMAACGLWFVRSVCVLLAGFAADTKAAQPPVPANDIAIQMSPYEVSANSVDFKRWSKLSSPNYIVYTDASEKEASAVIRELEMLHFAAQSFFRRRVLNLPPTIVVLPTSNSDWRKIQSKGNVEWKVAVSQPGEFLVNVILVQYDWQERSISIARAAQSRILLKALNLDGPFWFDRGVGSFFETAEFGPDTVTLGRQNWRTRSVVSDGWLPWTRFFQIDEKSPEFVKEFQVQRLDGQCAAFVQYMLANPEPAWFERLIEWAALMEAGTEATEAGFARVFGQDFKTWQKAMETYMSTGRYHVRTLRLPPGAIDFTPIKIDLPVREMRELFVVAQILNQRVKASEQSLDTLLTRGLKTESLREFLAEACYKWRRREAGSAQVRASIENGSVNPMLPVVLAMEVFERSGTKPSIHVRLSATDAEEIRGLCRKALAIEPHHAQANNVLAWAEALAPEVNADAVARIEKIHRVLADHVATSDVLSALAVARWRAGQHAAARTLGETLATSPFADKDGKEIAAALLKELGPPDAAAAP